MGTYFSAPDSSTSQPNAQETDSRYLPNGEFFSDTSEEEALAATFGSNFASGGDVSSTRHLNRQAKHSRGGMLSAGFGRHVSDFDRYKAREWAGLQ